MPKWFKLIWILAIIVNIVSFGWFLLGSTANFQRSLDLVGLPSLIVYGIPSLVLVFFSIILLIRKWDRPGFFIYVFTCLTIFLLFYLTEPLVKNVKKEGWLYESIQSDPLKLTSDGKYEYQLDLINYRQKNRHERLYLKNISTGEEMRIPVEINTDELIGISQGPRNNWAWALISLTDKPDHYELSTTENLRMTKKNFLIDVKAGVSRRIE